MLSSPFTAVITVYMNVSSILEAIVTIQGRNSEYFITLYKIP